jgi:hypothetical protein
MLLPWGVVPPNSHDLNSSRPLGTIMPGARRAHVVINDAFDADGIAEGRWREGGGNEGGGQQGVGEEDDTLSSTTSDSGSNLGWAATGRAGANGGSSAVDAALPTTSPLASTQRSSPQLSVRDMHTYKPAHPYTT